MAASIEKVVNITPQASGQGLRGVLEDEATSRGKGVRAFVGAIYEYAVANKKRFAGPVANARKKGGEHIGATVPAETKIALEAWADREKTSRGLWCCYLLESISTPSRARRSRRNVDALQSEWQRRDDRPVNGASCSEPA